MTRRDPIRARAKRAFDLAIAIPGAAIVGPICVLIALIVRARLGSPVLFRQQRPGLHGEPFTIYKFRTMTEARDAEGRLLPDSERLTRFGRWLRRTSLDELPELYNVLRGDMSLVGPRPLLTEYLPRYTAEQARRHDVRPGITGWTAVNGRNALDWDTKFTLDVWYVDNHSFLLDLKILVRTFWRIVRRDGISYPGSATAEEFMGSRSEAIDVRGSMEGEGI